MATVWEADPTKVRVILELEGEDKVELARHCDYLIGRVKLAAQQIRATQSTTVSLLDEEGGLLSMQFISGRPHITMKEIR